MGTSNSFGGPKSSTPLIPSWLPDTNSPSPVPAVAPPAEMPGAPQPDEKKPLPPIPPAPTDNRFKVARLNFTRFATTGDQRSIQRALGHYVRSGSSGKSGAARRMGSSSVTASKLASFVSRVQSSGTQEALAQVHLGDCVGRTASEVLPKLMDVMCPAGGGLDESIARQAFTEAVIDLCQGSDVMIENLSIDMWNEFLLDFIARSIEIKVINDIGNRVVAGPKTVEGVESAEAALHNFIIAGVRQSAGESLGKLGALTSTATNTAVQSIYEEAFGLWEQFADE